MDTLETLRRKIKGANDINSVVRTMKALAASNIGQYETAVKSLSEYFHTVELGLNVYFRNNKILFVDSNKTTALDLIPLNIVIVFGSDQGLIGNFNNLLAEFVAKELANKPGKIEIWSIGERVQLLLSDSDFEIGNSYIVPNSVDYITPLVGDILLEIEARNEKQDNNVYYIFHNQPLQPIGYTSVMQRLLPLDANWEHKYTKLNWSSNNLPQVQGDSKTTLKVLIREYLFISLFKACAESLASENASRLIAMQSAEKNIAELQDDLGHQFHRLRQSSIDEELFDLVSGFEALNKDKKVN